MDLTLAIKKIFFLTELHVLAHDTVFYAELLIETELTELRCFL
jgi:hypothetical protein